MRFNDKFSDLNTVDAALASLKDISQNLTDIERAALFSPNFKVTTNYDHIRIAGMIEGLQMVIVTNGGKLEPINLPTFYKKPAPKQPKEKGSVVPFSKG